MSAAQQTVRQNGKLFTCERGRINKCLNHSRVNSEGGRGGGKGKRDVSGSGAEKVRVNKRQTSGFVGSQHTGISPASFQTSDAINCFESHYVYVQQRR